MLYIFITEAQSTVILLYSRQHGIVTPFLFSIQHHYVSREKKSTLSRHFDPSRCCEKHLEIHRNIQTMEIASYLSVLDFRFHSSNRNQRPAKEKSRGSKQVISSIIRVRGSLLCRKLSHWDLWIVWRDRSANRK